MKAMLQEVAALQRNWSDKNTPEMVRRGTLIRNEIPALIREFAKDIEAAMAIPEVTIGVVGKDGTGRKTEIPWVRIFSAAHSPSPTEGWYIVLLFHATGQGLYLALVHGSTTWENGEFRPRATSEVDALLVWARLTLGARIEGRPDIKERIDLGSGRKLAKAYERSALAALWYPQANLPTSSRLKEDCLALAKLLGVLYEAVDCGRMPGTIPPEVAAAITVTDALAKGRDGKVRGGQGTGLSPNERRAVEHRAMEVAKIHLVELGFEVEDVSLKRPFDFVALKAGEEVIVEVKGTTSGPSQILLTANEVEAHRMRYPRNMLIVVHGIELNNRTSKPEASGGVVLTLFPWSISQEALKPISFRYVLGVGLVDLRGNEN
ncbi:MrcB family domain-containing protein [Ralstonia sp.]|uniref:MrcB family domain-containing protein n=1 Tax=Ralstonia sp. TaxID=54061 RepID=UPI002BEC6DB9|nr:DUF3578 domain-containing protein [Ralstonia sp.]HWV04824.1 DUF3578 domain-containing protein [Ralstonia sp.]